MTEINNVEGEKPIIQTGQIRGTDGVDKTSGQHQTDNGSITKSNTSESEVDLNKATLENPTTNTASPISFAPTAAQNMIVNLWIKQLELLHKIDKLNIEGDGQSLKFTLRLGQIKQKLQIELGNIQAAKHMVQAVGSFVNAGISGASMAATAGARTKIDDANAKGNQSSTAKRGDAIDSSNKTDPSKSTDPTKQDANDLTVQNKTPTDPKADPETSAATTDKSSSEIGPTEDSTTTSTSKPPEDSEASTKTSDEALIQKKSENDSKTTETPPKEEYSNNAGTGQNDKDTKIQQALQEIRDIQTRADLAKEAFRALTESATAALEVEAGKVNAQMEANSTYQSVNGTFGQDFSKSIDELERQYSEVLKVIDSYISSSTQLSQRLRSSSA